MRRCRISFPAVDLWKAARRFSALVRLPFPILYAPSIFLSGLVLSRWPRKEKERILKRLVIKSKQKGIDVIEVSRGHLSLSFSVPPSLSHFVSWGPSFPREIVSEKMAKITSETALFSTGSVNLYIHGRPFIHSNVNPFLFRSNRPPSLLYLLCLPRSFNFSNYVPSCLYNTPGERNERTSR